jgi:polyisoprenyl-phosphate glycosyltransferase
MENNQFDVAVILPVHNEEKNLPRLVKELDETFCVDTNFQKPQLIFINDGSTDGSREVIQEIVNFRGNSLYLGLSRNFGHQAAVIAGMRHAPTEAIVLVMDSDGQDPACVGKELVQQVAMGMDIVYGVRRKRRGSSPLKRFAYWSFYRLLSLLTKIDIPLDAGDFCAYSPQAVSHLSIMTEQHPYIRGLRAWVGMKQMGVLYDRPDRYSGETSYSLNRLMKLAFDGIIGFSLKPLRLALIIGTLIFIICLCLGLVYLVIYVFDISLMGMHPRVAPGFTTLILAVLALSGLQMMMLGIIGEYLGRVFEQVKERPLFIISEKYIVPKL